MRIVIIAIGLLLLISISAIAQQQKDKSNELISVTFSIDSKPVSCKTLQVRFRFDGLTIVPKIIDSSFVVPSAFEKKPSPDEKIDVSVRCGKHTLEFPQIYPAWISSGYWELGIAHPPFWFERFGSSAAIEHGTWLSYLEFECSGCDPGVLTTISHSTSLPRLVKLLLREQPSATGERARDIAYTLAVLGSEYRQNRDYLLSLLNACLSKSTLPAENDVCNARLLEYMTNLYWRGDSELLIPLLQIADDREDTIGQIGYFYGDLLDSRTNVVLQGMVILAAGKQQMVCKLAGEYDFSINSPKFERVSKRLRAIGNQIAQRCLEEAQIAVQGAQ